MSEAMKTKMCGEMVGGKFLYAGALKTFHLLHYFIVTTTIVFLDKKA